MINNDGTVNHKLIRCIPGLHFLCGNCELHLMNPVPSETPDDHHETVKENNVIKDNLPSTSDDTNPPEDDDSDSDSVVTVTDNIEFQRKLHIEPLITVQNVELHDQNPNIGRTDFMKRQISKQRDNSPLTSVSTTYKHDPVSTNTTDKSEKICKFYKKQCCKHGPSGKNCNFYHPPLCYKFISHGTRQPRGCNLGKKCAKFHPQMCLESLKKGECFRIDCKFRHIKGTRRQPQNQNVIKSSNQDSHSLTPDHNIAQSGPYPDNTVPFTQQNNFLEYLRQMQAELTQQMNIKFQEMHQDIMRQQQLNHQMREQITPQAFPLPLQVPIRMPLARQNQHVIYPQYNHQLN